VRENIAVTQGSKADVKSTATETTPASVASILKQVSASLQAIATSIPGTLTVAQTGVTTFTEATGGVAASGIYTGVARDLGAARGPYSYFSVLPQQWVRQHNEHVRAMVGGRLDVVLLRSKPRKRLGPTHRSSTATA
jgi:hypothetical protein